MPLPIKAFRRRKADLRNDNPVLFRPGGLARRSRTAAADLKRALAEPNLEKRSGLALENAAAAHQAVRAAYEKGDNEQVAAAAAEIEESVNLALHVADGDGQGPSQKSKMVQESRDRYARSAA